MITIFTSGLDICCDMTALCTQLSRAESKGKERTEDNMEKEKYDNMKRKPRTGRVGSGEGNNRWTYYVKNLHLHSRLLQEGDNENWSCCIGLPEMEIKSANA